MVESWYKSLRQFGTATYEVYVAPGNFVLTRFVELAPVTAADMGISVGDSGLAMMLSLIFWLLLAFVAWRAIDFCRNVIRISAAAARRIWYRLREVVGGWKTKLVCKFREWFPQNQQGGIDAVPHIDFDDLDIAVLRSAAARGPGFALSAPDLAEMFKLRPSQVQRSLARLQRNRMLDSVIGTTDGFENYRLTPQGATFIAIWQRQNDAG